MARQKDRSKETHRQREKRQRFTNIKKDRKTEWRCGRKIVTEKQSESKRNKHRNRDRKRQMNGYTN